MSVYRTHISPSPRQLVFRELIDGFTRLPFKPWETYNVPKLVQWMILEPQISDEDAKYIARQIYGEPCGRCTLPKIEHAWEILELSRVVSHWRDRLGEL